jgi:DNA-binding MarR family transcriptional regulator
VSDRVDEVIKAWQAELPEVLWETTEVTKRIMVLAAELESLTRRELPAFGLTGAEFDVLATLRRSGKPYRLKPNELSRSLLLSTGGTSNVVNRLESGGLVERTPDPDDGRSTLISLTAKGITLAEDALRATSAAHDELFAGVPPAVVAAATTALREMQAAIGTARQSRRRTSP